jgi:uncharacterized protein (UPF0210 family)
MRQISIVLLLLLSSAVAQNQPSSKTNAKPKVRAITAFVRLDRQQYEKQIGEALTVVRKAKAGFEAAGYEVETVRVTTQPLVELVAGLSEDQAYAFIGQLDQLAVKENFIPNVGPAMLHDSDDPASMRLLQRVLSTLPRIQGSAIIADEDGIHWKTIHHTAALVKYVSEHSPHSQGTFGFTATAMLKPLGPFFPGSYHTGAGRQFSIGFEAAGVVEEVFAKDHGKPDQAITDLTAAITRYASVADKVGNQVATDTGWSYAGVDPTPAPLGDVSIGAAIEALTGARFGSGGTLTAARVITTAVKAVPVKQVGFSGLMVPVMEDKLLSQRWAEGAYNIDSLLAYSAVCGTGLDTVPLPGDVTIEQMVRIFADVASLAVKWNKPLSARLQPAVNKKPGDQTDFEGQFLFNTKVQPVP